LDLIDLDCPERTALSKTVALAVQRSLAAKAEVDRVVNSGLDSNVQLNALAAALKHQREVALALTEHRREHGCAGERRRIVI